ncbi:MAG: helix-turn-helix domain-containing protein [Methylococcaceae bacterium]|nr:helix-turn-helix domain-containing protein [Methylococcaceae bacterium]
MEKLRGDAALAGSVPEKNLAYQTDSYFTDAASQHKRVLDWLQSHPLTTHQAYLELDVFHPAARVLELREQGHNIVTHWETVYTGKAKHRVASYLFHPEVSTMQGDNHVY